MNKLRRFILFTLLLAAVGSAYTLNSYAQINIVNLLDAEVLSGSSYLNINPASSGANLSIDWMPVFEFGNDFSIMTRYSGSYRTNRFLPEIENDYPMYQQTQGHLVSLKIIRHLPAEFTINAAGSFIADLERETAEKNWLSGPYNHNDVTIDLEIEKNFISEAFPCHIKFGYSYNNALFPNSLALADPGYIKQLTGTETAGEKIFDYNANKIALYIDTLTWSRAIFKCWYVIGYYNYPEQKIVNKSGGYDNEKRSDISHDVNFSFDWLFLEFMKDNVDLAVSLGTYIQVKSLSSNQNYYYYDTYFSQDELIPIFYDYWQQSISLPFKMQFVKPVKFNISVSYKYASRAYNTRLVQAASGTYLADNLKQNMSAWNIDFSYPLPMNFLIVLNAGFVNADSNMKYEKINPYNYSAFQYLAGIRYEH